MKAKISLIISFTVLAGAVIALAGTALAETEKFWEMGGVKQTKSFTMQRTGNLKIDAGGGSSIDCPTQELITANENNVASSTGLLHWSLDEEFTQKCTGAGDKFKDCQVKEIEDTNGATYTWTYHLTETKDKSKEMAITNAVIKMVLESVAGKTCPEKTLTLNFGKFIAAPDVPSKISSFTFSGEGTMKIDEKETISVTLSGSSAVLGLDKGTYGFL